jgi:hypothetical protein
MAAVTGDSLAVGADHRKTNNRDQDRDTGKKRTIHGKPPRKQVNSNNLNNRGQNI